MGEGVARIDCQALLQLGRTAWPTVSLAPEIFAAHVSALPTTVGDLHPDLYLACSCARGDAGGLAVFDRQLLCDVGLFVARVDAAPSFAEEVRQILREKLLVAPAGGAPRIAEYGGRGPLRAWLRVAAVRTAIDLLRQRGERPVSLSAAPPMSAGADPETALLRARYQGDYQEALRGALSTLTPKERNLLRMHFVDGMSVDRIGVAYRVHRATAARWVAAVRQRLLDETYRALGERLRLSPAEFASLTAVVQSQLHVSLSGLLRSAGASTADG